MFTCVKLNCCRRISKMFIRNFFVLLLQLPVTEPQQLPSVLGASPSQCVCQCCSNLSTPYHPKDTDLSESRQTHHNSASSSQSKKSCSRKIQSSWLDNFPWITVCTSRYVILCSTCRHAFNQNVTATQRQGGNAFLTTKFCNWRKAVQRFREHELSDMHREAAVKSVMIVLRDEQFSAVPSCGVIAQWLERWCALPEALGSIPSCAA